MTVGHLLDVLDGQARACTNLGSPMYGQLLARIIDDLKGDGVFTEVLAGHEDAVTPFVWLSLEPQRRTPDSAHEFLVRARCWPDGTDEILGVSAPHGPPVTWE